MLGWHVWRQPGKLEFYLGRFLSPDMRFSHLHFSRPGAFDVAIEVGGVVIDFYPGGRVKMQNPSRLGIDATIGDSVRFRGAVAWVDNDRENYFAAAGTLRSKVCQKPKLY